MQSCAEFEKLLASEQHLKSAGAIHRQLESNIDSVSGLKEVSGKLLVSQDKEEIFALVRDFYTLEKVREILDHEKEAFSQTPTYSATLEGNAEVSQAFFLLVRSHRFITLLTAVDPYMLKATKGLHPDEGKQVAFPSGNAELVMLKGELRCRLWETAPFNDATDLTTHRAHATVGDPFILKPGDVLRQADFKSMEYLPHDKGALFIHTQMMCGEAPLDIYCDYLSGELVRTSAPEGKYSRYQMMATLLRMRDRQDGFEVVRSLLKEPFHFLRWHAMRELIGLDAERALPDLIELANTDPQPAIRRAARITLTQVYGPDVEQAA